MISAGFILDGTCNQVQSCVVSEISARRDATKALKSRGGRLIQDRTMVESDHSHTLSKDRLSVDLSLCARREASTATLSSNLGIVRDLIGAILDLAQMRWLAVMFGGDN
mgnify:CR=1 FL=1